MDLWLEPARNLASRALARLPDFTAAFLFLLAGLFAARLVRTLAEKALSRARLDDATARVGINEILARLGAGHSPSALAGLALYWLILLVAFVSAANAVRLGAVSELLERLLLFLPSMISAILVLFGGMILARLLSRVVANAASANGIGGGEWLSKFAYGIAIVFSALVALEQLGLQMLLITSSLQILFASLGLAFALAFGLGGKDVAAEILRDLIKKTRQNGS